MSFKRLAAGRPAQLAQLYDARCESLLLGPSLWKQDTCERSFRTAPNCETKTNITSEDSFYRQARTGGFVGEQKLSFLSELIGGVEGSAKFFTDQAKTTKKGRVVMRFSCKTRHESLLIDDLSLHNIACSQHLINNLATHVVVGVDYGADAYFVFNCLAASDAKKKELSGLLKAKLNEHVANLSGEVSSKWSKDDETLAKNFSCKFYGDFILPKEPVCVKSALKPCAMLPTFLGSDNKLAVPQTLYFMPLSYLHERAAKLVQEVSEPLANRYTKICEQMSKQHCFATGILSEFPKARAFLALESKISSFLNDLQRGQTQLAANVSAVFPKIRGGEEDEHELEKILVKHDSSPLNGKVCATWLAQLRKDVRVIDDLLNKLQKEKIEFEQYDKVYSDKNIVCFVMTVRGDDEYLQQLAANVDKGKVTNGKTSIFLPAIAHVVHYLLDNEKKCTRGVGSLRWPNAIADRRKMQFIAVIWQLTSSLPPGMQFTNSCFSMGGRTLKC